MTKEEKEIQEVKNRILANSNISEEKKVLLLNEISQGKTFGFNSGYPSIDRPWLSFFKLDSYYKIDNNSTVYQDILKQNQNDLKNLAIMYFGGNISYKKMFEQIDKTAKSLEEYGIKKGDFVTVCCAGIPECIYTVYALAKIGAIANMMPPYFDKDQMSARISDCESDTLIVMDSFYPQIKESVNKSTVKKVIVIPTLNSSPLRYIPKKNKIKLNYVNELWWNQFIKDGNKRIVPETFSYEKDYPFCMVYSSGTTGASKAIVLSHDSFQYSVLSYDANTIDINRGQKMYQVVPPWYSTGLSTSVHLPLHYGVTIFQDPRFERDVFVKNIIKKKLDYSIGSTSLYEGFLDKRLTEGKKLSHMYTPVQGGEALNNDLKDKIEGVLKDMGVDTKIIVAYGQCECGAQVTSQSNKINHPADSVGIPIPGVTVKIVDDDFNELPYGGRGNIVVNTPCGMIGYYNRPDENEKYFHYDEFGTRWNCTGDIGSMGENGDLFVDGRAEDFSISEGKKIYNFDIERVLQGESDIKMCDCVSMVRDEISDGFVLHIIFDEESEKLYEENIEKLYDRLIEIQKRIFDEYNDIIMVPTEFKIRKEFPFKPFGKRDTEAMKRETDGLIHIDKNYLIEENKKIIKRI
ncbi:MAG: acyl--CoA ligase [Bacilli bacterium]|nr:acyl--CoA ligase [Bacilli bacterium]